MMLPNFFLLLSAATTLSALALPDPTPDASYGFTFDQIVGFFDDPACKGKPLSSYQPRGDNPTPDCTDTTQWRGKFLAVNWGSTTQNGQVTGAAKMRSLGFFKDGKCKQDAGWYALKPATWKEGMSSARACFAIDQFGGPFGGLQFWGAVNLQNGGKNNYPGVKGSVP